MNHNTLGSKPRHVYTRESSAVYLTLSVSCSTSHVITQASPDIRTKSPDSEQPYPTLAAVPPGVTAAKQKQARC